MRTLIIIFTLIILSLLTVLFLGFVESRKEKQLLQVEIDGLRLQNEQDEKRHLLAVDSIAKLQTAQADSTRYYRLLKTKDQQTVKTKTESHEKIVFVNLNDSARHSKLAKFYRSYKRP